MDNAPALPESTGVSALTAEEQTFVYYVEIVGLPVRKSADMAKMPIGRAMAPHIQQARKLARDELRGATAISKDDVVHGIRDAIDRARVISEPAVEIMGWEKIAKLLGYDSPATINVNIHASIDALRSQVGRMSDEELVRAVGAGAILDGDFYRVQNEE